MDKQIDTIKKELSDDLYTVFAPRGIIMLYSSKDS